MKWEGLELKGESRLQEFGIRSEDEITVEYYSEGDCVSVQESVQWMSTVIDEIKLKGLPTKLNGIITSIPQLDVNNQTLYFGCLSAEHFKPWKTPQKYTNKLYFKELCGLDLLLSLILEIEWMYVPPQLKYTEIIILETLGVFFENLSLQRLVISHGILDMLTRSLLRAKVQPGVKFMDDLAEKEWVDIPTLDQIVTTSIDILYW